MLTREEEVWVRAYCAALAVMTSMNARVAADAALAAFKASFPGPTEEELSARRATALDEARKRLEQARPGTPFKE